MTLALAILGVGLAAVSLGWHVWTYLHDGPRVKVKTSNAITTGVPGEGWYACISAVNRGRAATTFRGWGLESPDGESLVQARPMPWSAQVPHRLEPHSSADFHIDANEALATCRDRNVSPSTVKAWVRIGSGKQIAGGAPPINF